MRTPRPSTDMPTASQGYVLLLVLVLLSALMVGSVQFMSRTAVGAQISGTTRDHDEASLLAENAANLVLGRFIYGGDLNNDTIADNTQLAIDPSALDNPLQLNYVYAISNGFNAGISQHRPVLLQRVADGEAQGIAVPGSALDYSYAAQILRSDSPQLRIQQLFNVGNPLLYTAAPDGTLTKSESTWQAEPALRKAAVWLELVRQPNDDAYVGIYVEASAQIGHTRAHIQRFGGFLHTTLLGNLAALTESSTAGQNR
ncbi:MAG: hypothetical protein AABY83_12825 [Pseudomonadota bacterium]